MFQWQDMPYHTIAYHSGALNVLTRRHAALLHYSCIMSTSQSLLGHYQAEIKNSTLFYSQGQKEDPQT